MMMRSLADPSETAIPVPPARRKRTERGNALIEVTLLAPWLLFLFIGVLDMGFYTYTMIAVENAARVAAEYTSQSPAAALDQTGACARVQADLAALPKAGALVSCTAQSVTGPDGNPATSVSVTYRTALIPIPNLLTGRLNFTRNVQMRVRP
jgi:Flp pilus assembly protein TadG